MYRPCIVLYRTVPRRSTVLLLATYVSLPPYLRNVGGVEGGGGLSMKISSTVEHDEGLDEGRHSVVR